MREAKLARKAAGNTARPNVSAPAVVVAPIATPPVVAASHDVFDPTDWPVAEVLAYLDANPDDSERVLALETAGKSRKSILSRGD